ncbi:drebrin isoform X2 [Genypterus blacodes]|uniref:drebrin isoform X2 n=1 Tax=Genypterus blacodes TaxID=154954 RepID=UPI003F75E4A4
MLDEEEAKERLKNQPAIAAELSMDDPNMEKKETEEAKAIIAQRSENPREFFKLKEKGLGSSVDTSPVSVHRTEGSDTEGTTEGNMAAVTTIPQIITTSIKDDLSREDGCTDDWGSVPQQEHKPPVQESTPTRPVQSVAPQARDPASFSVWESGTDSLVELWDSSPVADAGSSNLVDLMGGGANDVPPPATSSSRPQPLLSFDDMTDGTFSSGPVVEDEPSSLVDMTGPDQMTLSYQHALQHASGERQKHGLDDGQLLMTNGDTLLKEGTQASEGYFSQSQEEEFGQSDECSAKPAPIFYNKPPEIDITCWDTDPVVDEEEDD